MTSTTDLADAPADTAIPKLMDAYADQIYGLGLRLCDDPEKAQDLVQETFLRALKSWEGFDGRSKPSTWLYTIASRACQRLERRRAGEPRRMRKLDQPLPGGDEVVDLPAGGETPLEWLERKDVVESVRHAIDSLPMHFRLPLVLKEIEGMSVEDVAKVLGVKPATVKTRLHRARLAVRDELSKPLPKRHLAEGEDAEGSACLDLLWAKQEALDKGVDFPVPGEHLCQRCRSVFATLDMADDVCYALGDAELPDEARRKLETLVMGDRDG